MFFEDDETQYKLVAPDVDALLRYFDHCSLNPNPSTPALLEAFTSISDILEPLAPLKKNEEAKAIWLRVPRGNIEDYTSFEDMKAWDEVETYEEYETRWHEEYPEEYSWYELVAVKSVDRDNKLRYYGISLGNERVISASAEDRTFFGNEGYYSEDAAVKLCSLILPAVRDSIALLQAGSYNKIVEEELPYQFRVGVIPRAELWKYDSEMKKYAYDGLSEDAVREFKKLISSGINDESKIGRIKRFTANDFFRACKIGYEAIGKDCSGFSLPDLYMHYADGRDEGLTGQGHGLNAGPGIDFDDPGAWDEWYYGKRGGGHPWEVVPGGNSTHVELYVRNDKRDLEWMLRTGEITEEEYGTRLENAGTILISPVRKGNLKR